jgi:hypothetical protein
VFLENCNVHGHGHGNGNGHCNISKNLPTWNQGGRQIIMGPIFRIPHTKIRSSFLGRILTKICVQRGSKLTRKTFYSKFRLICMKLIS